MDFFFFSTVYVRWENRHLKVHSDQDADANRLMARLCCAFLGLKNTSLPALETKTPFTLCVLITHFLKQMTASYLKEF